MLKFKILLFFLLLSIISIFKLKALDQLSSSTLLIDSSSNPLSKFSADWNKPNFKDCNTAVKEDYLSVEEKKIIWILNMARRDPQLFLNSVILNPTCDFYKEEKKRNNYDWSLIKKLKTLTSNPIILAPNHDAYLSAQCHAYYSGLKGYVGHKRIHSACKEDFLGECCQYGFEDALSIVLALLLDYDVPSLGHREICLSTEYKSIGVAIEQHKRYSYNTVLDFK